MKTAIGRSAHHPVNAAALEASIQDIDAWLKAGVPLSEVENEVAFGESIMLVVHELKRLRSTAAEARVAELERLINNPETDDWLSGARLEAAHQVERWGSAHDAGKTAWDWFWLIGYLAQKAAAAQVAGDGHKAKHHTISTAAALLNWHRALTGSSSVMRPGIDPVARGVE